MEKSTGMVFITTHIMIDIKENGKKAKRTDVEYYNMHLVLCIRANG